MNLSRQQQQRVSTCTGDLCAMCTVDSKRRNETKSTRPHRGKRFPISKCFIFVSHSNTHVNIEAHTKQKQRNIPAHKHQSPNFFRPTKLSSFHRKCRRRTWLLCSPEPQSHHENKREMRNRPKLFSALTRVFYPRVKNISTSYQKNMFFKPC